MDSPELIDVEKKLRDLSMKSLLLEKNYGYTAYTEDEKWSSRLDPSRLDQSGLPKSQSYPEIGIRNEKFLGKSESGLTPATRDELTKVTKAILNAHEVVKSLLYLRDSLKKSKCAYILQVLWHFLRLKKRVSYLLWHIWHGCILLHICLRRDFKFPGRLSDPQEHV